MLVSCVVIVFADVGFFFFNDTATTDISALSLHDALPICGRSRHLARKLSLRRKRSSPNVFEMAATETITSIVLIKLLSVSLGTLRDQNRFITIVLKTKIPMTLILRD